MLGFTSGISILFHWSLRLPLCHYHTVFDQYSVVVIFQIRKCESSNFILLQLCFGYPGSLEISYEICFFSISAENVIGIFINIILHLQIAFGNSIISILLSLLIHKHKISFIYLYLFKSLQSNIFQFSVQSNLDRVARKSFHDYQ